MAPNEALSVDFISEDDFWVDLILAIGPSDSDGADLFQLGVCSPAALARVGEDGRSGHGLFVMTSYDERKVRWWVERCCAHAAAPSWDEAARALSRWFCWEFDGYRSR